MNFLAFWRVIPAWMTSGSLRNSVYFNRTPLLTSALSLYVTSTAMCGLPCRVFRACRDDLLAVYLNYRLSFGN